MAINSLNWERKPRSLLQKFLSCEVLFSKTVQTKSVQINSVPATIYHWTSLVSLCVAPCFPTLDTVLEYILSVYLTVTAAVNRETLLFFSDLDHFSPVLSPPVQDGNFPIACFPISYLCFHAFVRINFPDCILWQKL